MTSATLLLSSVAVWGTSRGYGTFVHGGPNESLLLLQMFIGTAALMTYLLYGVMRERERSEAEKLALAAQVQLQRKRVEDIVAHIPAWCGKPGAP